VAQPSDHGLSPLASWVLAHGEVLVPVAFVLMALVLALLLALLWIQAGARWIVVLWVWRRALAWWRARAGPGGSGGSGGSGGASGRRPGGAGGDRERSPEYRAYMRSPAWRRRRARVLRRAGRRCRGCGGPARDVHHLWYGTPLGSEPDAALAPLCEACHAQAHGR
jgi:hypothetical protein